MLVEVETDGFRVLRAASRVELPSFASAISQTAPPEGLVAELRAWRTTRAREDGVPAYVVLHDSTLDELAARRPVSRGELASIRGLGNDPLHGVWGGRKWQWTNPDQKAWLERAAERGFTAPTWPREYGGGGLSAEEAKVLGQEMARLRLPQPLIGFGLTMIGPTLLRFGNEEQKREHLPKITRGEILRSVRAVWTLRLGRDV